MNTTLLLTLSLVLFSFNAVAAPSTTAVDSEKAVVKPGVAKLTYDLKMNLSIDGKKVSTPHTIIAAGETASITQENNGETIFMDVTATEDKSTTTKPSVKLEFLVGKVAANGERIIFSSPQIIALENEEAEITSVDENQSISVSVTATRQ